MPVPLPVALVVAEMLVAMRPVVGWFLSSESLGFLSVCFFSKFKIQSFCFVCAFLKTSSPIFFLPGGRGIVLWGGLKISIPNEQNCQTTFIFLLVSVSVNF